ncbi:MAG TPA: phosphatidylglycerol lysyltransferase domain-containing protein [Polyangiaceae bacterium]
MEAARLLDALRAYGRDAASFQSLEPGVAVFAERDVTVAYCDTGAAWVGVGRPLAEDVADAAERFERAARAAGRRALYFACDGAAPFGAKHRALVVGEQPWWRAGDWPAVVSSNRSLREQIRRAKKKGVTVREVSADELRDGAPMRARVDALAAAWLASRPMQPMLFLLTLAMFEAPAEHRYFAAERAGALVAFVSLVPIYANKGYLVEDLVRDRSAPNGTTELLFDCALRTVPPDSPVTWGLAPLAGAPWPMRAIGKLARGLYDFRGLRAFKARLHPSEWQPVTLVLPSGASRALAIVDVLRAFAGGSLVRFGVGTLVSRPLLLPWVLTLLLVPWTTLLVVLLVAHHAVPLLAFPRGELYGWAAFDALFAVALIRAFRQPRFGAYAFLGCAALVDALVSTLHVAHTGFGVSPAATLARTASAVAPALAALGLFRCARATFVSKY